MSTLKITYSERRMKFLIIDEANYLTNLAEQINNEGYDSQYVSSIKDARKEHADIVLANTVIPFHHTTHNFIGITESIYTIITDKEYMLRVLKVMEIATPPFHIAQEGEVSTDIVEDSTKYAIETTAFPSYFTKGTEDAIAMLELFNEHGLVTLVRELPYTFTLEVEGWFNGGEVMIPAYLILDGNIMHPLSHQSKLYRQTLQKFEVALKKMDYKGPVSMSVGIAPETTYSWQVDCMFRPMVFEAMTKVSDNLRAVVTGAKDTLEMYGKWTEQLPILLDPFILSTYDLPLLGYERANKKHLWISNLIEKDNKHYYKGLVERVGYVTARGETPRETGRRVNRTRQNLVMPFSQWCSTSKRVNERYKMLREWEWL